MKYVTTLEVARELNVSKQTLLNWLYAKKVPEPPRNRNGYRLWSPARVSLVRQLIREGRLHRRTVVHREPIDDPVVVLEVAREVSQFLKDADIPIRRFVRELNQVHGRRERKRPAAAARALAGCRSSLPGDVGHQEPLDGLPALEVGGADLAEVRLRDPGVPDVVGLDGDHGPAAAVLEAVRPVGHHPRLEPALAQDAPSGGRRAPGRPSRRTTPSGCPGGGS